MLRRSQRFTPNKQVVRDLQCEVILRYLSALKGQLGYFGLPSSSLEDVLQWSPLLKRITAVERGQDDQGWRLQNELLANAFRHGILSKLTLLRGDIDQVLIKGRDDFGNEPEWPFDIVSLDYSGGLFYQDAHAKPVRLTALQSLFERQSAAEISQFVLFLSFNLDQIDHREVRETIKSIGRDLRRFGEKADMVVDAYLKHPLEQGRLKLYVMNLIGKLAAQEKFDSESESPLFYSGNRNSQMMAFRFYLKRSPRTFAPRSPKERLNQIVNRRMIEIVRGKQVPTNLGLPLLKENTSDN